MTTALCNHASAACGACPHAVSHEVIWYGGDDLEAKHGNANCLGEEYCHYVHTTVICVPEMLLDENGNRSIFDDVDA